MGRCNKSNKALLIFEHFFNQIMQDMNSKAEDKFSKMTYQEAFKIFAG